MKWILLLTTVFAASIAGAQSSPSQASYIKKARIELEKENELKILEMLEAQRLREEKARMQKIEALSFSVAAPQQAATQTY